MCFSPCVLVLFAKPNLDSFFFFSITLWNEIKWLQIYKDKKDGKCLWKELRVTVMNTIFKICEYNCFFYSYVFNSCEWCVPAHARDECSLFVRLPFVQGLQVVWRVYSVFCIAAEYCSSYLSLVSIFLIKNVHEFHFVLLL